MTTNVETEFIESLGLILQRDGLPRIAGRLLAVFVLHGGPFSFSELGNRLQVSRGSVSTNTRLLEDLGAIQRVSRPGDRQDYFRLADQPYAQLIERWIQRSRRAQETIDRAARGIDAEKPDTKQRLAELSAFYRIMAIASEGALTDLRNPSVQEIEEPRARAR